MAGIKISGLPTLTSLNGDETFIVDDSTTTKKVSINTLIDYYGGSDSVINIVPVTTSYTLALSDIGSYIRASTSSSKIFTVLPNSSINWPVGSIITIKSVDSTAGFSLSGSSGVTLNSLTSSFSPFQSTQLINISANFWDVL
jgi:hypothetical protein